MKLALSIFTVLAIGCGQPSRDELVIGVSALRISLPVFVADREGLFTRHGLHVRLQRYETAQPMAEEILDGRLLAGGYVALPIVLTAAARDGSRARMVTLLEEDRAHPVSYLLRRAGDERLTSIASLSGKRVGILPTIAYRRWLEAVLRHAGVDVASVTIVNVAPAQQSAALASESVDALLTNDPMATAMLAGGVAEPIAGAPVPSALGGSLHFGTFILHPRLSSERPEDARRLAAALDEAIALIQADQARARAHMRDFVRPDERGFVDRYPDARYLPSGEVSDAVLQAEVARETQLGILDAPIDVTGWSGP